MGDRENGFRNFWMISQIGYLSISRFAFRHSASSAESTLKVGVYFNIFPNFLAISESGGVTKSRPIDPFFI